MAQRYVSLQQFKARGAPDLCPVKFEWCETACTNCVNCKSESRDWSDCWSWCDECNRCKAAAVGNNRYSDPYNYILQPRTLQQTCALSKQFCDNICGVNLCNEYRQQNSAYKFCKRVGSTGCERMYGCKNPNGEQFGYVPPIDPMYNNCKACWKK